MKKTITFIAVVAVIGVMALALVWRRGQEPYVDEIAPPTVASQRIIDRTEPELTRVTFMGQDRHEIMVPVYDEDGRRQWTWYGVDYLLNAAATRDKIRGAFILFSSQTVHEYVADVPGLNLADFGFDPPYMTIIAEYEDGTSATIIMGGPTVDLAARFVMVEGDPGLHTITRLNADRLLLGLEDMIEFSLPQWHMEAITYIKVAQRDRDIIEFEMQPHREFEEVSVLTIVQPPAFEGREVFPSGFTYRIFDDFMAFTLDGVVSVHPPDLAVYGLDAPSLEFVYRSYLGDTHLLFGDVFFRETAGGEEAFIYVKFAGRPHVFEARYETASLLFDMNVLQFIERFIALVFISDLERLEVTTPDGVFDIVINPVEDSIEIEPTINGEPVDESDFRLTYRLLIGLNVDAEVEPFTPRGAPLYTVRYFLFDGDEIEIRFFDYDAGFLAVSVDGEDVWSITNRRNFDLFAARFRGLE